MRDMKLALGFGAIALVVVFACLARYEVLPVTPGGQGGQAYAYRLDRWTGTVVFLAGTEQKSVELK